MMDRSTLARIGGNLWNSWTPYLAVGVCVFAVNLRFIFSFDYWTHLAFGKVYWEAGTFSIPEPFLFHGQENPISVGKKPFQVLLYGLRNLVSDEGISVFIALVALAAFAPLLVFAKRRLSREQGWLYLVYLLGIIHVAQFRFLPRPESIAYILLAGGLILASQIATRPTVARIWGMIALFWFWMVLHITWTMGLAVIGAYLVFRFKPATWKPFLATKAGMITVAAVSLGGIIGLIGQIDFAVHLVKGMNIGGRMEFIQEMQPTWKFPVIVQPALALAVIGLLPTWGGKEGRIARIVLWAGAVAIGAAVVRNVTFAMMVIAFTSAEGLAGMRLAAPDRLKAWIGRDRFARMVPIAGGGAVALGVAALLWVSYPWHLGVHWPRFPRQAAQYVKEMGLPGPIFNNFEMGGFLNFAWEGNPKTFIDGRALGGAAVLADHNAALGGHRSDRILNRRGFNTIVISSLSYGNGELFKMIPWLLRTPDWVLVHASDGLVFTRSRFADGKAVSHQYLWLSVLDYAAVIRSSNKKPHLDYTRGIAYMALRKWDEALKSFLVGVAAFPELKDRYGPYIAMANRMSGHQASESKNRIH